MKLLIIIFALLIGGLLLFYSDHQRNQPIIDHYIILTTKYRSGRYYSPRAWKITTKKSKGKREEIDVKRL